MSDTQVETREQYDAYFRQCQSIADYAVVTDGGEKLWQEKFDRLFPKGHERRDDALDCVLGEVEELQRNAEVVLESVHAAIAAEE
jgi:hypothetical protein